MVFMIIIVISFLEERQEVVTILFFLDEML